MDYDTKLTRARLSISALFFLHGCIYATWVSRIPAVQGRLQLSPAILGTSLAGVGLGSLISMPITGWLIARHGSRLLCSVSSVAFCLVLLLPGVAWSALTLGIALTLFGAAAGSMDVSMNAQGVELERRYGTPIMSSLHALFSLSGMAGSVLSAVLAAHAVAPLTHFTGSAAAFAAVTIAVLPMMIYESPPPVEHGQKRLRVSAALAGLSALAVCFLLSEGAMADWSSVYLRSSVHASPGVAASGYAFFSALMAIGRLCGDRLTVRIGRVQLVRYGSLFAAAGLGTALAVGTVPAALAGIACVGAGFSVIVPLVFGAAGRLEDSTGPGLAAVTTVGYLGFLAGPPIIGFTAEHLTLRVAMGILVLLSLLGSALARFAA
jgi:MFS family permease